MEVTIFTQIGFVVLVGLASKNAILIVEFAKQQQEAGVPRWQATVEACKLRLRPILMTSFAFILGVVPLVIAEGAGAEMRRSLGLAVFSGMLGVTLFGIFLTPVFFYVLQWFGRQPSGDAWVPVPASPEGSRWPTSVKQVEAALEALRQSPEDSEARRRTADALKSALHELHEQPDSADETSFTETQREEVPPARE